MLQDKNPVVNTYKKKAIEAKIFNKFLKQFINNITKLNNFVCVLLTKLLKNGHYNNTFSHIIIFYFS